MKIFLMTYEYKQSKIDGFTIVRAKTYEDASKKMKEFFQDKVKITGARTCGELTSAWSQILMTYDREMFFD